MISLLRKLEDILWPRGLKCICCDEYAQGEPLCPDCRNALEAMRLSPKQTGDDQVRSVYRYDGVAKQLVLALKLENVADAAIPLADAMAAVALEMQLPPDTVLTWVTMPDQRRRQRGIDHGRRLCEAVAARTGLPAQKLLSRTGRFHTQRGLSREERLRNLGGTVACNQNVTTPVLLIDDVLTTGATISICAEVLLKAGAPAVYALTATRVKPSANHSNEYQKG